MKLSLACTVFLFLALAAGSVLGGDDESVGFESPPARMVGYVYLDGGLLADGEHRLLARSDQWSERVAIDKQGRYRLDIGMSDELRPGAPISVDLVGPDGEVLSRSRLGSLPQLGAQKRIDLRF